MRVALDIEMEGQIVCLLGGGQVAVRKAKQFVQAGAEVYLYSLEYDKRLNDLCVHVVSKEELMHILPESLLAVACTDDEKVNKEFVRLAKSHHILAMSCQNHQGQNAFSMVREETGDLVLACHTQGAFPVANRKILSDWRFRLHDLKIIREQIKDHSISKCILELDDRHIEWLKQALQMKKAIVYVMHGNTSYEALRQCSYLESYVQKHFQRTAVTTWFMAPRYQDISLKTLRNILQGLDIQVHYVLLFWNDGHYVQEALSDLKGESLQWIRLDPQQLVQEYETPVLHTDAPTALKHGVVVSVLDSPFLKKQYPQYRFSACLDQKKQVERICDETKPCF